MALTAMGPLPIIDTDSHVTEPVDVWTARVQKRFAEYAPHVEVHPKTEHHHWKIGDHWFWPVSGGALGQAGWHEYLPSSPWEYEDIDPGAHNAAARLERMNEYGIDIQLLYPNLVGFAAAALIPFGDEISVDIVRAYNDFIWEWSSADRERLIPTAMLPFWNIDESVKEMQRCVELGFKGVLFANKFERLGLPSFVDPYWDRIYAAAQDLDIPINYHVGFGDLEEVMSEEEMEKRRVGPAEERQQFAREIAGMLMTQNNVLGTLLTSGLCERFPRLKLVSVETGFGHIPFYLESLDWHWKVHGNRDALPLLPSEYFKRQCYGTFWFETSTLRDLDQYPDNFMFSTDYPHSTGLAPGPCAGTDQMPSEYVAQAYADLDEEVRAKALYKNANNVYGLALRERALAGRS